MHPLHDVPCVEPVDAFAPVIVEIPAGSKLKFEIDKKTGLLALDRVLHAAVRYPLNYGFFPQTLGDDEDPLDALVLMQEPLPPLTIVRARILGGFAMRDDKGGDDKLLCVAMDDPMYAHVDSVEEISPQLIEEIRGFFSDYKRAEGKYSEVGELYGRDHALAVLRRAMQQYSPPSVSFSV
jgi:inorganic pyrophosphatase